MIDNNLTEFCQSKEYVDPKEKLSKSFSIHPHNFFVERYANVDFGVNFEEMKRTQNMGYQIPFKKFPKKEKKKVVKNKLSQNSGLYCLNYSIPQNFLFPGDKGKRKDLSKKLSLKKHSRNFARNEHPKNNNIDINKIFDKKKTTLMIKNIPNKYTKKMMLEEINDSFKGTFDFFYLPIDFDNNCNVGYAFINLKEMKFIKSFYLRFYNKKWKRFNSEKICDLKYAKIQGRDKCRVHFNNSSLMKQNDSKLKPFLDF